MKTGRMHGWEKIVRGMKAGPDFGIHGATYENLQSILAENRRNKESGEPYLYDTFGHRFTINDKTKSIDDEEFYKCLVASVGSALCYSKCYGERLIQPDGNIKFTDFPCLLIGIDVKGKCLLDAENTRFDFMAPWIKKGNGEDIKSFDIGHDFYGGLEMAGLTLGQNETDKINDRWKDFSRGKQFLGGGLVAAFFAQRECIERMIRKIYCEMRKYGGKAK